MDNTLFDRLVASMQALEDKDGGLPSIPDITFKVTGRPLPKGMSKCIVGFIVRKRTNAI